MSNKRPEPAPDMREYCRQLEGVERNQYRASVGMLICIVGIAVVCIAMALLLASCVPVRPAAPTLTPSPTLTATATATSKATARPAARASATSSPTPAACIVANTGGDVLNIRRAPGMDAEIVGGLLPGARVTVIAWGDGWLQIQQGYISAEYCEVTR